MNQKTKTPKFLAGLGCLALACATSQAGSLTSQVGAPTLGAYDIAQLVAPDRDVLNINGPGQTSSGANDGATYVANDRNVSQGQLFTTGAGAGSFTLTGIWVEHVNYTTYLDNGTFSGLNDGTSLTLRIVDPSLQNTAGFVLGSQVSTVATGSGIGGGGTWGGTGNWLYMALDTPLTLAGNTQYGFDLTSYNPWFELAGMDANQIGGGSAYTTGAKEALNTGTVYGGDRTFVAAMSPVPEPTSLALLGLGGAALVLRRRRA